MYSYPTGESLDGLITHSTYCTMQRTLHDLYEMRLIFFLRALLEKRPT